MVVQELVNLARSMICKQHSANNTILQDITEMVNGHEHRVADGSRHRHLMLPPSQFALFQLMEL
jgi:hypothetical protein